MGKVVDIKGQRFGRLIAVRALKLDRHGKMQWRCKCDCGGYTITAVTALRAGKSRSCGCYQRERAGEANTTHGETRNRKKVGITAEYRTWMAMNRRCYNKNTLDYKNYGARGIEVCARWRNSFSNFLADMGRRPKRHSIDRVKVNKNYTPKNSRWATKKVQANNRRAITRAKQTLTFVGG